MIKSLMKVLLGDKQARDMKRLMPMTVEINEVFAEYEQISDEDLSLKTAEFRRLLKAVPRVSRVGDAVINHEAAEGFLERHPDIAAATFLGTRRDFHSGDLIAFVIVNEGVEKTGDLASQIREGMGRMSAEHKPKSVIFLDEFPKNAEGKDRDFHLMMRSIEELDFEPWEDLSWGDVRNQLDEKKDDETLSLDEILPEAFAAVKEACRRHIGKKWMAGGAEIEWNMVPFDVQLAGGISLHEGNISEMATGEGKTLVAILPLYINALTARGAHLVTVNDYLSKRDSEWMTPIFNFLGMSVGCIDKSEPHTPERRHAYRCDITYGTNNEFGFDYLRDNMALDKAQLVQRPHHYCIIDEVDSVLIDEARTPLIIAGPVDRSTHQYDKLLPMVRELVNKQQMLVGRLAKEAQDLLEEDPDSWEGGYKLLLCGKGMPKHNRYMKLREDPHNNKLQDKIENQLMLEKKMRELEKELYFMVEEKNRQLELTEKGRMTLSPQDPDYFVLPDLLDEFAKVEQNESLTKEDREAEKLEIRKKHDEKSEELHSISQLLHAFALKNRDVDYVIEEGKIVIVDEYTGRKMPGRRWSDGLHAAVEAKEGVTIEKETQTLATITIQNYFRLYEKLSGMTGTAETEASEFAHTYSMDVVVIPSNVPTARQDLDDIIYKTKREKYKAVIDEIERLHGLNLPILVGTTSVAVSETVSRMLRAKRLSHAVLNAKNHQREAEIVANAGKPGSITIATNMAGRGTDIKLGEGVRDSRDTDDDEWPGGLQIIGTERHESRRIDRQLRGRAGRQGDPGTSRFFVSLEDDLMRWFGSEKLSTWMGRLGMGEGEPIFHPMVTKAIGRAQKKVEGINQERRKKTLEYDDVMNKQRETIYKLRRELLVEPELREVMLDVFADAIEGVFSADYGQPANMSTWDTEGFFDYISRVLFMMDVGELRDRKYTTFEQLLEAVMEFVVEAYEQKGEMLGAEMTNSLSRYISLRTIDAEWQDHLLAIDSLREGVGLRGYGQRDPLIEFTKDATDMFSDMLLAVHREIFDRFFRFQVVTPEEQERRRVKQMSYQKAEAGSAAPQAAPAEQQQAPARPRRPQTGLSTYRRNTPKVRRNDPCPCGSGKKFKDCCGAAGRHESRSHMVAPQEPPPEE
ncbi:preprotein translocase subunit SecA [bacterium]|nr:preprotein translocase subunit SecA [bacterium]